MIKKNKAIAGVLLFTMLLSGIPEGFGAVSYVYADEPVASVETEAELDSGEQTPEDDNLDEDNPSEEEKKIIEEQGADPGQDAEDSPVEQLKETNDQEPVEHKIEKKDDALEKLLTW